MAVYRVEWDGEFPPACRHGALTIGNFDGVHLGHQALLAELRRQADAVAGPAVAMTFDPHPEQLLRPDFFVHYLTTTDQKAALLQAHGTDVVLVVHTTRQLLSLSARDFFDRVVRASIAPKVVVPGFNFRFGHNREGTIEVLEQLCAEAGMRCVPVPPSLYHDEIVSSSRIRAALQAGNVRLAAALLGRPYAITGRVRAGSGRGRSLGFPTANLHDIATLIPANGVYAVRVKVGDACRPGACNIGPNPTFDEHEKKVEVHLLDFDDDLNGREITIEFIDRLRETRRFDSPGDLCEQLRRDVEAARRTVAMAQRP